MSHLVAALRREIARRKANRARRHVRKHCWRVRELLSRGKRVDELEAYLEELADHFGDAAKLHPEGAGAD